MSAAIEPFVQDLLDALGLEPGTVQRLQIDCQAGRLCQITVRRWAGVAGSITNRYRLVPQDCADPADVLPVDENLGSC